MVVGPATPAGQNPHFQAVVARAHLESRHSAPMVVGVDQPGNDGIVQTTQFLVRAALRPEGLVRANFLDNPILLVNRRIVKDGGFTGASRTEQVLAANQ